MKTKRTREEWIKKVKDYKDSGLSIQKYCRIHNIASSTFNYWVKKSKNPITIKSKELVKISVPVETNRTMKLSFNQITVEFPADFFTDQISKLITALKEV